MRAGAVAERISRDRRGRSTMAFLLVVVYSFLSGVRIDPTLAGARGDGRKAIDSSPMLVGSNATSSPSLPSPRDDRHLSLASCTSTTPDSDWMLLCANHLADSIVDRLAIGEEVHVVQIGAHVGFEPNDPIAGGLSRLLDEIVDATKEKELRSHFHWTFVEPSPPNYKRLAENMAKHSNVCDMKAIHGAVLPDNHRSQEAPPGGESAMVFYSIRDTIDPETGFDTLSKKRFPHWVSQISSFSKETVFKQGHQRPFRRLGLNMKDYVVETKVPTNSYTDLLAQIQEPYATNEADETIPPLLVLVDTEGFDCDIVEGISPSSSLLPAYLIFEHKHCKSDAAVKHVEGMGYATHRTKENVIAVKQQ